MPWRTTAKSLGIFMVFAGLLLILIQWKYIQTPFTANTTETNQDLDPTRRRDNRRSGQEKTLRGLKQILKQRANTTGTITSWKKTKGRICGQTWQEKYKKLHQDILDSKSPPRYLVFHCGGVGYGCGGYGNRIGGITSLLYLAVLTKRALLIDWRSNISITDYFTPKNIKWDYSVTNLHGLKLRRHFFGRGFHENIPTNVVRPAYRFDKFAAWLQTIDLENYFDHEVEYISTQWYFAPVLRRNKFLGRTALEMAPKRRGHRYSLIGCAFDFLFQRTPRFERLLNKARKSLQWKTGIPRIGIHFRAGDSTAFNTLKHSKTSFLSSFERFLQCAKNLEQLLKKLDPTLDTSLIKWFLGTDIKEVKNYGKKKYPKKIKYIDVQIEHISKTDPSRLGIEGVLLDSVLLSECDVLIMSNSSFSRTAHGMAFHSLFVNALGDSCKY